MSVVAKENIVGTTSVRLFELCLILLLIVAVSLATYSRNIKWDDRYVMWSDVAIHSAAKWRPYYRLGLIHHQSGRYERALTSLERAYGLKPDARGILSNMGLSLQRLGRVSEAEAIYARAIEGADNPSVAYLNLGTLHLRRGDTLRALASFNSAIEADPTSVVALVNAGFTCGDTRNYKKAAAYHKRAIELNPYYANAYYGLAIALEGLGNVGGATEQWQNYLKAGPRKGQWRERALINIERLKGLEKDVQVR
jgi:tetratricopeptide (TPR) repeat protein